MTARKSISLSSAMTGHKRISQAAIAKSNTRIKTVMSEVIRENQKKQKISIEKASKMVLNS